MGNWRTYLELNEAAQDAAFLDFLRIPSVSTDPNAKEAVREAAEFAMAGLEAAGVPDVRLWESPGHPAVFGQWLTDPSLPTVLIYGHYDVQPAEPLELWESPPFEPTEREGIIYARGSADMKANMSTLIDAVAALNSEFGKPPINLKFIFEGEEEIGSPNLPTLIEQNRELMKADFALSADGGMFGADQPSMTVGLKGIAACQVDLISGSTDLHSGGYGAAVPNAVQALVQLAATFHDAEGNVLVEGFYDDVEALSPAEQTEIAAIPFDKDEFLAEAGVSGEWGPRRFSMVERRWTWPTIDFNGIWGGFQGEGTKTVTPSVAHLKITSRLVANQNPEKILDLIEAHVNANSPAHVKTVFIRFAGSAKPFLVDREDPAVAATATVLERAYGKVPYFTRSGGSVPITEVFNDLLGITTVTIGFGLPGSRAHAPNEWFRAQDLAKARQVYALFFQELANIRYS